MDTAQVEADARRIRELKSALDWMLVYGDRVLVPKDKDAFSVVFSINSSSAFAGAKEAERQLGAWARHHASAILADAIKDAQNTIDILREKIAREVTLSK